MEHGVNINPVAFLVVQNDTVKLLPVDHCSTIDKLADYIPDIVTKVNDFINKKEDKKQEQTTTINYTYSEQDNNVKE